MNKTLMIVLIVLIFLADILWQMYRNKKRDAFFNELSHFLAVKDFDAFDKLIEDKKVKRLFPPYNIAFLKLNEALIKGNAKQIDQAFEQFDGPMNKIQKEALYRKAFIYYVEVEDKDKAKNYYDLLKQLNPKDQLSLDATFDTYINKGYRYLEPSLEEIEKLNEEEKIPYAVLIAEMYRNKKENDKAEEYEKIVSEYTEKLLKNEGGL